MPFRFSRLIPRRFRFAILAIIVISIGVIAFAAYDQMRSNHLRESKPVLLQTASLIRDLARQRYDLIRNYQYQEENHFHLRLAEIADLVASFSRSLDYLASRGAINRTIAQNLINQTILEQHFSDIGYAYILSPEGLIVTHPKLPRDFDLSGYQFVKEMLSRKNGVTRYWWKNPGEIQSRERLAVYRTLDAWKWIIVFAIPITDIRNTSFEEQQLEGFFDYVEGLRLRWRGYVTILSDEQEVIAHPMHDLASLEHVPGAAEILNCRDSVCSFRDLDGSVCWAGVTYFQPWGWRIAVVAPESEILREIQPVGHRLVGYAVLIAILAITLVVITSRRALLHALHTARKIHHIN